MRHPHLGVPKSKPRLPRIKTNGKPASKEEISALCHEYLVSRNAMLRAKTQKAEIEAAIQRGELVQKRLV
jgi:hypothetical protein